MGRRPARPLGPGANTAGVRACIAHRSRRLGFRRFRDTAGAETRRPRTALYGPSIRRRHSRAKRQCGKLAGIKGKCWRAGRDSNPRPSGSKYELAPRSDARLRTLALQGHARSGTRLQRHRLLALSGSNCGGVLSRARSPAPPRPLLSQPTPVRIGPSCNGLRTTAKECGGGGRLPIRMEHFIRFEMRRSSRVTRPSVEQAGAR